MNSALMFSRTRDDWQTPPAFFAELASEFSFGLDAAADHDNALCSTWFGPGGVALDALTVSWGDFVSAGTSVWLNPPYSRNRAFLAKAASAAADGLTVVVLVPARTDTQWFHRYVWDITRQQPRPGVEVRFLPGRLRFVGAVHPAPFPSAVIVFKPCDIAR